MNLYKNNQIIKHIYGKDHTAANEQVRYVYKGSDLVWALYDIDFYSDGVRISHEEVVRDNPITKPSNPVKKDFIFNGWSESLGGTVVEVTTTAVKNVAYYAVFTEDANYTVTHNILCFGCEPTATMTNLTTSKTTTIQTKQAKVTTISQIGKSSHEGRLTFSGIEDNTSVIVEPSVYKKDDHTIEYTFKNMTITTNIIHLMHMFEAIFDKSHEDVNIYSPGFLCLGYKYKFHFNIDALLDDKELDYGVVKVGHAGNRKSHEMNFGIKYKIINENKYKNRSFYALFNYSLSDKATVPTRWNNNRSAAITLTDMSSTSKYIYIKDFVIDLSTIKPSDKYAEIGIYLKDNGEGCTGVLFGFKSGKGSTQYDTKCLILSIEKP